MHIKKGKKKIPRTKERIQPYGVKSASMKTKEKINKQYFDSTSPWTSDLQIPKWYMHVNTWKNRLERNTNVLLKDTIGRHMNSFYCNHMMPVSITIWDDYKEIEQGKKKLQLVHLL